jgi:hypothetical protein
VFSQANPHHVHEQGAKNMSGKKLQKAAPFQYYCGEWLFTACVVFSVLYAGETRGVSAWPFPHVLVKSELTSKPDAALVASISPKTQKEQSRGVGYCE